MKMTRNKKIAAALAAVVIIGGAIGSGGGEDTSPTATPEASITAEATTPETEATAPETEATAPEAEATVPATEATAPEAEATKAPTRKGTKVMDASPELMAQIAEGANVPGNVNPIKGAVMRSSDFKETYFVSIRFENVAGVEKVGTWAVSSIDPANPGITVAVDEVAHDFTHWPYGPDTAFEITMKDNGARQTAAAAWED